MRNKKAAQFAIYVASIILIGVYVLSYVGFSIHKCTCEDSTSVSILIGFPSCEKLHTHIHISTDGEHHHCEHDHHEGCCDTEILVLTTEQTNPDLHALFAALSSGIATFYHYPDMYKMEPLSELMVAEIDDGGDHTRQTLSQLSVWRL